MKRAAAILACAWLAGCASVPYQPPAMPMPAAYRESHGVGADAIAPDWWRAYHDATLDALLTQPEVYRSAYEDAGLVVA